MVISFVNSLATGEKTTHLVTGQVSRYSIGQWGMILQSDWLMVGLIEILGILDNQLVKKHAFLMIAYFFYTKAIYIQDDALVFIS